MARLGVWRWWSPRYSRTIRRAGDASDARRSLRSRRVNLYPEVERACVDVLAVWLGDPRAVDDVDLCLRSPNAMFPAGCREALPASLQKSARIVGAATVRSGLAVFAVSRRRRRCSVRRWRRAYSSRTHSATGAFHGCCGEGTFFRRLRGLKPSSFAICTSAAESRQRRAASVHSLSIPSFFSAIDEALPRLSLIHI